MSSMSGQKRRAATLEEARALAHPLRLRILRLCLDEALTNKQLAERLGKDPGTVLHHVRALVDTGFLAAEEVRQGQSGALEKPYRSTGKSWTLDVSEATGSHASTAEAILEAFLAEFREAGPAAAVGWSRLALTLDQASLEELGQLGGGTATSSSPAPLTTVTGLRCISQKGAAPWRLCACLRRCTAR